MAILHAVMPVRTPPPAMVSLRLSRLPCGREATADRRPAQEVLSIAFADAFRAAALHVLREFRAHRRPPRRRASQPLLIEERAAASRAQSAHCRHDT